METGVQLAPDHKRATQSGPTTEAIRSERHSAIGMTEIVKLVANGPTFLILYIVFVVPTYVLPYFGSNSSVLYTLGSVTGVGLHPVFWIHAASLVLLIVLAWCRAGYVGKPWIVSFPILAMIFDLVPTLNVIPLVPTVMHLSAIIFGISSVQREQPKSEG